MPVALDASLDRASRIPVFAQIRARLQAAIETGALTPNQRLPSERQLSELFGVSRMTVRQAIDAMTHDRLLYVVQGKGTFVADPRIIKQPLHDLTSFTQDITSRGMRPSSRVVDGRIFRATFELARLFEIAVTAEIIQLTRLRLADDEPLAIETAHIPAAYAPGLLEHDLERNSLYSILGGEYGLILAQAHQTIEADEPTDEEIRLLEMDGKRPVLRISRITFDATGRIVEYVRAVYRGDRYHLTVELR